eukprot:scaffold53653_cov70-Phaeocystis_antarctica.AAC.6
MTTSALEAATTTRVDCGAAVSEKAPAQARQATRTKERMVWGVKKGRERSTLCGLETIRNPSSLASGLRSFSLG